MLYFKCQISSNINFSTNNFDTSVNIHEIHNMSASTSRLLKNNCLFIHLLSFSVLLRSTGTGYHSRYIHEENAGDRPGCDECFMCLRFHVDGHGWTWMDMNSGIHPHAPIHAYKSCRRSSAEINMLSEIARNPHRLRMFEQLMLIKNDKDG